MFSYRNALVVAFSFAFASHAAGELIEARTDYEAMVVEIGKASADPLSTRVSQLLSFRQHAGDYLQPNSETARLIRLGLPRENSGQFGFVPTNLGVWQAMPFSALNSQSTRPGSKALSAEQPMSAHAEDAISTRWRSLTIPAVRSSPTSVTPSSFQTVQLSMWANVYGNPELVSRRTMEAGGSQIREMAELYAEAQRLLDNVGDTSAGPLTSSFSPAADGESFPIESVVAVPMVIALVDVPEAANAVSLLMILATVGAYSWRRQNWKPAYLTAMP